LNGLRLSRSLPLPFLWLLGGSSNLLCFLMPLILLLSPTLLVLFLPLSVTVSRVLVINTLPLMIWFLLKTGREFWGGWVFPDLRRWPPTVITMTSLFPSYVSKSPSFAHTSVFFHRPVRSLFFDAAFPTFSPYFCFPFQPLPTPPGLRGFQTSDCCPVRSFGDSLSLITLIGLSL